MTGLMNFGSAAVLGLSKACLMVSLDDVILLLFWSSVASSLSSDTVLSFIWITVPSISGWLPSSTVLSPSSSCFEAVNSSSRFTRMFSMLSGASMSVDARTSLPNFEYVVDPDELNSISVDAVGVNSVDPLDPEDVQLCTVFNIELVGVVLDRSEDGVLKIDTTRAF